MGLEPLADTTLRLSPRLLARLRARADGRGVRLSQLLRSYVEAGDRADTRREQKNADQPA